jgi:hypothetical protein
MVVSENEGSKIVKRELVLAVLVGLAVALFVGCNPIYVDQDYDPSVDFSRYKSFSWMEVPVADPQNATQARQTSSLVAKRIQTAVAKELTAKGYEEFVQEGDLLVVFYIGGQEYTEIKQSAYSRADVWANSRVGGGVSGTDVTAGTLIIDLVDAGRKELVWRGTAENAHKSETSQEKLNETLDKAIAKVFEKYPPKK